MRFNGKEPIFIQVSNYFENLIKAGAFKPGDFLPSVRDIAELENINPNTVNKAYINLANKNLVTSIPKKGYYVNAIQYDNKYLELENEIKNLLNLYTFDEISAVLQRFSENKEENK